MLEFILDFVIFLNENDFCISEDKVKRFIKLFNSLDIENYDSLISSMKTSFCACREESASLEEYFLEFLIKIDEYKTKKALEIKEKKLKEDFEKMTFESQDEIDKINKQIDEIIKLLADKDYGERASDKNELQMLALAKKYSKKCPEISDFLEEIKKNGESIAMQKYFNKIDVILKEITKISEKMLMKNDEKSFNDMQKLFFIIERDKRLFKSTEEKRQDEIKRKVSPFKKQINDIENKIKKEQKEINKTNEAISKIIEKSNSRINRKEFKNAKNFVLQNNVELNGVFEKDFRNLSDKDYKQLYDYIKQNIVKFKTKITRNVIVKNKNLINLQETIKNACKTGGLPLKIFYEKPKPSKANIILVLDVSGSCKGASKLMLTFMYLLKDAFPRGCKAFVFVNNLYEITNILENNDTLSSIDKVFETVQTRGVYSNYYIPLKSLGTLHRNKINKDSIVIFIGDARNNKNQSGLEYLKDISRKCKKCFFLNTDDFNKWGQGDSVAFEYAKYAKMYECKNVKQILSFLETFR